MSKPNAVADITLDQSLIFGEGETQRVCAVVDEQSYERERNIYISFSVTPESYGASSNLIPKHACMNDPIQHTISDSSDLIIENMSSIIPPGSSEACLQLEAVDDDIVEGVDVFAVTADSADTVNGNVSIIVTDNDGELK